MYQSFRQRLAHRGVAQAAQPARLSLEAVLERHVVDLHAYRHCIGHDEAKSEAPDFRFEHDFPPFLPSQNKKRTAPHGAVRFAFATRHLFLPPASPKSLARIEVFAALTIAKRRKEC